MVKRTGASFVFDLDVTSLRSADENEAMSQLELFQNSKHITLDTNNVLQTHMISRTKNKGQVFQQYGPDVSVGHDKRIFTIF